MTNAEFKKWVERHCAIFAFDQNLYATTFAEWLGIFRDCGYTAAELDAATSELARRGEPLSWLRDHLPAIHQTIRGRRISERRRFESEKYRISDDEIAKGREILAPYLNRIGRLSGRREREKGQRR